MLSMTVREFIAAAAAKTPTPGGGSVAGIVGALGVALGEMALNFTRGKKKYAQHEPSYQHLASRLARAREMFQQLVADDAAAYRNYQETSRMEPSPARAEAMQVAVAAAIDVPREATKLALAVLADLRDLTDKCSPYLVSDLAAGAALAEAACRLCDYNVRINLPQVSDAQAADDLRAASAGDLARAADLRRQIEQAVGAQLP